MSCKSHRQCACVKGAEWRLFIAVAILEPFNAFETGFRYMGQEFLNVTKLTGLPMPTDGEGAVRLLLR